VTKYLSFRLLSYAILFLWALAALMPLYWIFCTALKPPLVVLEMPPKFVPSPPTLINFKRLFGTQPVAAPWLLSLLGVQTIPAIWRWLFNSAFVSLVVTFSNVFLATLAGYALAKKRFPASQFIFWLILSMMLVPGQLTIIPLYEMVIRLNWMNTFYALIVPAMVGPFAIFLMKQFLQTLPSELLDAAKIDGCSELGVFLRVVIPLAKPGMAVLAIFTFMGEWNDFLWPLIVMNKESMLTLQVGLANLQNVFITDYGLLMAGAAFSAIPMMVVFFLFQRHFVKGITIGALKG
jgi:multiple sugar transport system permease protein